MTITELRKPQQARAALTPITVVTATTFVGDPAKAQPGKAVKTRQEIWSARSADGTWDYERLEGTGTPWLVRHRPTGHIEQMSSLARARRWTANGALDTIKSKAKAVIDTLGHDAGAAMRQIAMFGMPTQEREAARAKLAEQAAERAAARLARARQTIAILDQTLLPAGAQPQTQCVCGGLLTWQAAAKTWAHVNGCAECWNPQDGWQSGQCVTPARHCWCTEPDPLPCQHLACRQEMSVAEYPCEADLGDCCGCCQPGDAYQPGK